MGVRYFYISAVIYLFYLGNLTLYMLCIQHLYLLNSARPVIPTRQVRNPLKPFPDLPAYIYIFFHDGSFRVVSRVIFFQNVCIFARIEVWEIFIAVMTAVYLLIEMHQAFWEVSYVLIRLAIL